jgi:glutamate--cysteine ligase
MKNYQYNSATSHLKGNQWLKALFGVEKENIRVDNQGVIAQTPHPNVFGDKLKHPYITTDFSESQVEIITPPLPSINETLGFLETIHDLVSVELKDEFLWPQSIPPVLPSEEQIPIAQYQHLGKEEEEYRKKLANKYGRKKQALSGIHVNISLDENLLAQLHQLVDPEISFDEFKDLAYLKITRQLLRNRWLYILLFGNSPVVDPSFDLRCRNLPVYLDTKSQGLSFRNSCFGYGNLEELFPNYTSVEAYLASIEEMVRKGTIAAAKELYASVRPKFLNGSKHISYIEVRFVDINPLRKAGISAEAIRFIHSMVVHGLLSNESDDFNPARQTIANMNHEDVSLFGLDKNFSVVTANGKSIIGWGEAQRIVHEMKETFSQLEINDPDYRAMFSYVESLINKPQKRDVHKLIEEIDKKGFIGFHLEKAQEYLEQSRANRFNFRGFEDLELSTQLMLRETIKRGVFFEILDRQENFVRLSRDGNIQYVRQATKTSLDNYASILVMENKVVTKRILEENGIRVPKGMNYTQPKQAKSDFFLFKNRAVVVKPKSTNFGEGITILKENNDAAIFERAIDIAFEADDSIMVEEFIAGKEFRIFVMNDEVVGILHRVPANVTGDGQKTIHELVTEKNLDPLRGKGYKTPLEKIRMGEAEQMFLAAQGKTFDTIPAENETVYLRENSNISTGGDSIDFTDDIPDSYKQIAVKAAKELGVKITGLDMIISDYTQEATSENYAIIELNFNPAIHIHCHPYKGKNRKLNEKLLDLLGYSVLNLQSVPKKLKQSVCCCLIG